MNKNVLFSAATLSPSNIYLDTSNLRLFNGAFPYKFWEAPLDDEVAQEYLRRHLLQKQSAKLLVESILEIGFLPMDRIVVRKFSKDKYVVIEGNRRIAAIKSILGDAFIKVIKVDKQILASLNEIEVLVLRTSQEEANLSAELLLQGVRHVSGVRNWGPFQQGKLVQVLVEERRYNFQQAARSVGLSPSRVATLLRSYYGMSQLMNNCDYGQFADLSLFSCFEHAYLKIPVREWLGWDDELRGYTSMENLDFFYSCIVTKDKKTPPRLMARHIRDFLPSILENDEAKAEFINNSAQVEDAYRMSVGYRAEFSPLIETADKILNRAELENTDCFSSEDLAILTKLHKWTERILESR